MDKKKLKDLAIRTASGVVFLLVVVGAILLSQWSVVALFGVIMLGSLVEFFRLCQKRGYKPNIFIGITAAIAIFGIGMGLCLASMNDAEGQFLLCGCGNADHHEFSREINWILVEVSAISACIAFILIPILFIVEIWRKSETPIANIATTFMGTLYVSLPMALIAIIPQMLVKSWNPWVMLAFISIIWVNDVFAYLVGVSIGKHRLCERISPKKSWEGFFGGLLGAIGVSILYGHLFEGNLFMWGGLGLVTALAGVAGDLIESMFKREVGVKDSGNMMPGHGGFLDRFDALFIAVPFVIIYSIFFM